MNEKTISKFSNCIDKGSGSSYEALFMEDGSINVCRYDGAVIDSYSNILEANIKYMFF